MQRVVPDAASTPTKRPDAVAYELRASAEQLPVIHCTKGVKDAWLSAVWLTRFNAALRRNKRMLGVTHAVGLVSGIVALFGPASIGGAFGVAACVFNLPGSVVGLLVLRHDMAKVLLRTYEFWYLSTMNAMAMALTMVLFRDLRSLSLVPVALGFEITILIDANYRAVHATMRASVMSGLILCAFMVVALLHLVLDAHNPPILSYGARSMSVVDGIVNCLSTVVLMLWRNALRKHLVLDTMSETVRCITYRCRVRWCAVVPQPPPSPSATKTSSTRKVLVRESSNRVQLVPLPPPVAPLTQLQFVPSTGVFDPTCTVFQSVYEPSVLALAWPTRWLLHATSMIGLTTTIAVFATDSAHSALPVISCASTLVFSVVYLAHAQRRVLWLLCTSFDFVFVSLQLSIAHLCVCDGLYWDARALAVLSSWLWVHWVLTIDAVTPVMRVRLGYNRQLARLVVLLLIVAHVLLSMELVVWNRLALQDRAVVATTIGRQRVHVRVVPVLFGRMATTVCWSGRLLARLLRRADDELIMVQGGVMFHDYERERIRQRTRERRASASTSGDVAIVPR